MTTLHEWQEADDETQVLGPIEVPVDETALDAVRRRREEHQAEKTYDLLPPGYGGCLVLRLGPPTAEVQTMTRLRMEKLERKKDPNRDFALNADTLIAVCEEVLVRKTRAAPLEPVLVDGEPVALDAGLAEALGVTVDPRHPGRSLVRDLFRGAPAPEIAVGVHVNQYLEWAQGLDADSDEELLGESQAGTP